MEGKKKDGAELWISLIAKVYDNTDIDVSNKIPNRVIVETVQTRLKSRTSRELTENEMEFLISCMGWTHVI